MDSKSLNLSLKSRDGADELTGRAHMLSNVLGAGLQADWRVACNCRTGERVECASRWIFIASSPSALIVSSDFIPKELKATLYIRQ